MGTRRFIFFIIIFFASNIYSQSVDDLELNLQRLSHEKFRVRKKAQKNIEAILANSAAEAFDVIIKFSKHNPILLKDPESRTRLEEVLSKQTTKNPVLFSILAQEYPFLIDSEQAFRDFKNSYVNSNSYDDKAQQETIKELVLRSRAEKPLLHPLHHSIFWTFQINSPKIRKQLLYEIFIPTVASLGVETISHLQEIVDFKKYKTQIVELFSAVLDIESTSDEGMFSDAIFEALAKDLKDDYPPILLQIVQNYRYFRDYLKTGLSKHDCDLLVRLLSEVADHHSYYFLRDLVLNKDIHNDLRKFAHKNLKEICSLEQEISEEWECHLTTITKKDLPIYN